MRRKDKCPDSQRSTWTVVWCNSGLGISRHPPVIRFRQAFKDLRRGNTNATVPYPSFSLAWYGWTCAALLFAWLTLVISWVAFLSFRSFVTFSSLSACYISPSPHSSSRRSTEWPSNIVTDAVFSRDHAFAFVFS